MKKATNKAQNKPVIKIPSLKKSAIGYPNERVTPIEMKPIGILGGGQLSRMLALKAHELGLKISILSENADDPAAQVAPNWKKGNLASRHDLEKFLKECSIATFESEFLDAKLLEELALKTGTLILPRPATMGLIQDRLTQKEMLLKHDLPTAKFHKVDSADEAWWARMVLGGGDLVFKKRRFGYDGYGTYIIRSKKDMENFVRNELSANKNPSGFIAESFVPFKRELALMIARSANGQTRLLPFVETFQKDSRCLWVKGPVKPDSRVQKLTKKLAKFVAEINYCGVMGVEIFDSGKELSINELAPRVHNSGHYSLNALMEDQFTLHLKCILGQPLGDVRLLAKAFAMMNLIGSKTNPPNWKLTPDIALHWYGKKDNRPGRKMGHLNALGDTPAKALATAVQARKQFEV